MKMRKYATLALCVCMLLAMSVTSYGVYLPDVTAEMSRPEYWSEMQKNPDEVLMTSGEIAAQNSLNIAAKGTNMYDMKNQPDTINGITQRDNLVKSGQSDADYYLGWTFDSAGNKVDQAFYDRMISNMIDPNALEEQPMEYAIAVNRTTLNTYPSDEQILDDPADPDFDYQYLTGVRVNEPLVILAHSADGKYCLARSICCPGWVPVEDIAFCSSKEEWLQAWDFDPEKALVVWGSYTTAASNFAPEISRRLLTQGTVLEQVELEDPHMLVNNRAAYNNYVVNMPVRKEDGSYEKKLCLIAESAQVSDGYLPMTKENISRTALSQLGNMYGWGGMLLSDDCSGYVRNIYKCFGLELARNTTWQAAMPVFYTNLAGLSAEKKTAVIRKLPLGSTLFFKGHEMMYLGSTGDHLYVISSSSSIMNPDVAGKRQRSRDVTINTLEIKRANGNTWLQDLTGANVPYYSADSSLTDPSTMEDVAADAWSYEAVNWAITNLVTEGTSENRFSPELECNRAQMVTFMWRAAGMPEPASSNNPFEDVRPEDYYYKAVLWAVEQNITSGISDNTFGPEQSCTRGQAVTFLYRGEKSPAQDAVSNPFEDVKADAYYYDPVQWAVNENITNGTGEHTFSPDGICTRAQIVTFLYRDQKAA